MAETEYKYVSLKDVLRDNSIPKLKLREPNVESQEELEFEILCKNSRNPRFPSSPSFFFVGSCCDNRMKTKGLRAPFSGLKHSRSDDPLVYVECDDEEEEKEDDEAYDDLETFSQEMNNFSWEERILKPACFSESEEEEEK